MKANMFFVGAALLFVLSVPAQAQDEAQAAMDDLKQTEAAIEQDARDVLGERASPPTLSDDSRSDDGDASQIGNAGTFSGTVTSSGSSHTETRSESSSVSVGIDLGGGDREADSRPPGGWGRPHDGFDVKDVASDWTLTLDGGGNCRISLQNYPWFGRYKAYVPVTCPDPLSDTNSWMLAGNQLQITNQDGQVFARFWPAGYNRWVGHRESDGAHLYLNR
jgi:hypothetical protein